MIENNTIIFYGMQRPVRVITIIQEKGSVWVNIRRESKMCQRTKDTAKCKNVGYICQMTQILFTFLNFYLFRWHGTGGQSVRIYTDAVEFIVLVNLLLD